LRKVKGRNGGTLHVLEKGETANRKGQPLSFKALLLDILENKEEYVIIKDAELLDENNKPTGERVTIRYKAPTKDKIMLAWTKKATSGDLKAIDMIMDRTEGKAVQIIDATIKIPEKSKLVNPDGTEWKPGK
jgi:hypothetical protein